MTAFKEVDRPLRKATAIMPRIARAIITSIRPIPLELPVKDRHRFLRSSMGYLPDEIATLRSQ